MEWGFMSFEALVTDLVIWRGLSGKTRNKQHGISRMWIIMGSKAGSTVLESFF